MNRSIQFNEGEGTVTHWPPVQKHHVETIASELYHGHCLECNEYGINCGPKLVTTESLVVKGHDIITGAIVDVNNSEGTIPNTCTIKGITLEV